MGFSKTVIDIVPPLSITKRMITICHVETGKPLLRCKRASLGPFKLDGADLKFADFSDQDLSGSTLTSCNFSGSSFARANLQDVRIRNCIFRKCNFNESSLVKANIADSIFDESVMKKIRMERSVAIRVKLNRCNLWDAYCTAADFSFSEFANSDFRFANLTSVNFCDARLVQL